MNTNSYSTLISTFSIFVMTTVGIYHGLGYMMQGLPHYCHNCQHWCFSGICFACIDE
jgi:hypothetical protein